MGFFDPFCEAADVGELKSDLSSVKSDIKAHTDNNDIHVTASDKSNWNNKVDKNQGAENSGKVLGTNANGEVIPINGYGFEYDEETKMLKYGTDPTSNLNQGIGLDDTLSKTGYAADAGAVGELKEDLDGLIINDKHNYCGNGASEDSPAKLTLSERGELYILSEYKYSFINLTTVEIGQSRDIWKRDINVPLKENNSIFIDIDLTFVKPSECLKFNMAFIDNDGNVQDIIVSLDKTAMSSGNYKYSGTVNVKATSHGSLCVYFESVNYTAIRGSIKMYQYEPTVSELYYDGVTYKITETEYIGKDDCIANGKLHKNGTYICNSGNVPVELRGVGLHQILLYNNLHSWKSFYSLKKMGVNMIRVSVYLNDIDAVSSNGITGYGYLNHKEETINHIEYIVKNCIDLGLYVLLDWHHYDPKDGYVLTYLDEAKEFFSYFSSKYSDTPNILYELCNEPYSDSVEDVASFASQIRDIIVTNVENPIMVCGYGSYSGTQYERMKAQYDAFTSLGFNDVFVSPHIYGGGIDGNVEYAISMGVPVFVTECGNSTYSGDGDGNDVAFVRDLNKFHELCVSVAVWKFTDQTMTTSILNNRRFINSEKYKDGFENSDLSYNGKLLLGKYKSFVTDEWIEREPIN